MKTWWQRKYNSTKEVTMPVPPKQPVKQEEDQYHYDEQALFEYGDIIQEYSERLREDRFSMDE